jgi:hypothetical protein
MDYLKNKFLLYRFSVWLDIFRKWKLLRIKCLKIWTQIVTSNDSIIMSEKLVIKFRLVKILSELFYFLQIDVDLFQLSFWREIFSILSSCSFSLMFRNVNQTLKNYWSPSKVVLNNRGLLYELNIWKFSIISDFYFSSLNKILLILILSMILLFNFFPNSSIIFMIN